MKIKTSKLTGRTLDWAVAKCEDALWDSEGEPAAYQQAYPEYTTSWQHGGPIIENEGINLTYKWWNGEWHATKQVNPAYPTLPGRLHQITRWHPTSSLIAAMRCYVASKLGDEIEIPEELLSST